MPSWRKPLWSSLPFLREGWRAAEAEREARLAAEAAGERLALLADVTKALTSSFELDVMLGDLARLITPGSPMRSSSTWWKRTAPSGRAPGRWPPAVKPGPPGSTPSSR